MTTFTREQLVTLRKIAQQATQDEWRAFISSDTGTYAVYTPGDKRCDDVIKWPGFDGQKNAENNARYIAAFNPKVVLALLDVLDASLDAKPVASCIVEDGGMCVDGFSEYVGHLLPDGMHELYAAPPVRRPDGREAVAWKVTFTQVDQESNMFTAIYFDKAEVEHWVRLHKACDFRADITPLYAAPPVPVVPEEISMSSSLPLMSDQLMALGYVKGWNACREAMLKGKGE